MSKSEYSGSGDYWELLWRHKKLIAEYNNVCKQRMFYQSTLKDLRSINRKLQKAITMQIGKPILIIPREEMIKMNKDVEEGIAKVINNPNYR